MKKVIECMLSGVIFVSFLAGCNADKKYSSKAARNALDLSGRDTTANPATNFFEYANGTWLKNTKIPPSKTGWGSFYIVRDKSLRKMRTILDSVSAMYDAAPNSIEQQTGDLYASAMDSTAVEKAGIKPLQDDLNHIASIKNSDDVLSEVAREYKLGEGTLFNFYVGPDDKSSMVERAHFNQGGLGLPNKNYYLKDDKNSKQIRKAYKKYIAKILTLSGTSDGKAQNTADDIINFETQLAKASKTPVQLRQPMKNYHLFTLDKFNRQTPNISWQPLTSQLNIDIDTVQVGQPQFYKQLSSLLTSAPLDTWKTYLRFHLINGFASWLSSPFADAHFDFYKRRLNGQKQPQKRWRRAASLVNHQLGDALGKLYVERYFPPSAKKYMRGMVKNLQLTYKQRIDSVRWMSDSTKIQAKGKLDAFIKKIGYPDEWKDYSSINIDSSSIINNLKRTGRWHYEYMTDKLGKPVDRTEWQMTAPTVNAYYNPSFNEVVFPAGILQPPFYYQGADDAINYGAVGAVIGHEMTHGFDDQGSKYDKNGNLNSWWSKKDRKRFEQRTQQVVKQYNSYTVLDSVHVNGELTLGENIADIGGLAIAHAAFEKTEQAKGGKKINGLTPEQRFFMAFGQVWRMKNTPKHLRYRIQNDPHSPEKYRVIGPTSNMKSFYRAFNVQLSDSMYRPDSIRVQIW